MAAIYQERLEFLNTYVFPAINLVLPLSLILVIYSSLRYHDRYVRNDAYHNSIIGVKFYEIDEKRRSCGTATLLPLNSVLTDKYVGLFDLRMTSYERKYTIESLIRLFLAFSPLLLALWLNDKFVALNVYIISNTAFEMEWSSSERDGAIRGNGLVADTLRHMFESQGSYHKINNINCLPKVSLIDQTVHRTMGYSVVILLCLTCFQAYIKRMRSFLCGCVYPERDHERAIWLYNHLLSLYSRYFKITFIFF